MADLRRAASARPRTASPRFAPERVEESDEIYVLSAESGDSVKVRDGHLDVKRLERVDGDGLERWPPF